MRLSSRSFHTSDLNIVAPVGTLPGARISASEFGLAGPVSQYYDGLNGNLVCDFCLSVAARATA